MYSNLSYGLDIMNSIEGFDLFNSEKILKLDTMNAYDIHKVNKFVGRLDLLSNELYGSYDNYGLLGIVNRIEDPIDIYLGRYLKVPFKSGLYNL